MDLVIVPLTPVGGNGKSRACTLLVSSAALARPLPPPRRRRAPGRGAASLGMRARAALRAIAGLGRDSEGVVLGGWIGFKGAVPRAGNTGLVDVFASPVVALR